MHILYSVTDKPVNQESYRICHVKMEELGVQGVTWLGSKCRAMELAAKREAKLDHHIILYRVDYFVYRVHLQT